MYTKEDIKNYSISTEDYRLIGGLYKLIDMSNSLNNTGLTLFDSNDDYEEFEKIYLDDIKKKYNSYVEDNLTLISKTSLNFTSDFIAQKDFDAEIKRKYKINEAIVFRNYLKL